MKRVSSLVTLITACVLVVSSALPAYASSTVTLPPSTWFTSEPITPTVSAAPVQNQTKPGPLETEPPEEKYPDIPDSVRKEIEANGLEIVTVKVIGESEADQEDSAEEQAYQAAEELLQNGRPNLAGLAFYKLGNYRDATKRSEEAWKKAAVKNTIAADFEHSIGVRSDGTVVTAGKLETEGAPRKKRYLQNWSGVVSVAAGREFSIGLKSDGSVIARGIDYHGECSLNDWKNVISIAAGREHTLGLRSDGKVYAKGNNGFGQCNLDSWSSIVVIAAGEYHSVGLRADGTVVAKGQNTSGQCNVSGWKDIVAICAGDYHTVGVKADGTVVATGYNNYHQCDVSGWKDIVAVSAGSGHTLGLKSDGTVVSCGYASAVKGRHADVSDWGHVIQIACGTDSSFGLRDDGQAVAAGLNESGVCDVQDWNKLRNPA